MQELPDRVSCCADHLMPTVLDRRMESVASSETAPKLQGPHHAGVSETEREREGEGADLLRLSASQEY